MASRKVYTVTDLGGGDGGKGGVVHKLCVLRKPHTVVKVGGAQGSHGVWTAAGQNFNFSQFGCGTFNGSKTHVSDRFVFSPDMFLNEAKILRYEQGVDNPLQMVTVDENALCTTPMHGIVSRLRELARKGNPRGTVGTGVGECYHDSLVHPELVLRAKDLGRTDIRDVLEAIRLQKIRDLAEIMEMEFMERDQDEAQEHIALLRGPAFVDWTEQRFHEVAKRVRIVGREFLEREILGRDGVVVFESSHGVLTDRYHGFTPHTSKLRTVPEITTWNLLAECGYDGQIVKLGVTRAYQIRHGAGPLVTEDAVMTDELIPQVAEDYDRYRGKIRVGPLDFVALRYAVEVCGGPKAFDGIAVTWFDQVEKLGVWKVCDRYVGADDMDYFTPEGGLVVCHGTDAAQLTHQENLSRLLRECRPVVDTYQVDSGMTREQKTALCSSVFAEQLGVPVRMMSFGPTEKDKELL